MIRRKLTRKSSITYDFSRIAVVRAQNSAKLIYKPQFRDEAIFRKTFDLSHHSSSMTPKAIYQRVSLKNRKSCCTMKTPADLKAIFQRKSPSFETLKLKKNHLVQNTEQNAKDWKKDRFSLNQFCTVGVQSLDFQPLRPSTLHPFLSIQKASETMLKDRQDKINVKKIASLKRGYRNSIHKIIPRTNSAHPAKGIKFLKKKTETEEVYPTPWNYQSVGQYQLF